MGIRIATEQDLAQILSIYGPYVKNTTVSFEYEVPTLEEFRSRFETFTEQFPWLVWEENGVIAGYTYACAPFSRAAYRWCAEPSIYLRPEYHGKGIGRKLYTALETFLRLQGYHVSYAIITSENTASLDFHRSMGYSLLAEFPQCAYKHGKCLGIIWMEKRLHSAKLPSNAPVSFSSFVENSKNFTEILDNLSLS